MLWSSAAVPTGGGVQLSRPDHVLQEVAIELVGAGVLSAEQRVPFEIKLPKCAPRAAAAHRLVDSASAD